MHKWVISELTKCNKWSATEISAGASTIYKQLNDLDEGTECMLAKAADETKIGRTVSCEEDIRSLQKDIERLRKPENKQIMENIMWEINTCPL